MNKTKKSKIQLLMKVTALTIVCVMISQFFPSIVFCVRQWNELQGNEIVTTEETGQSETKKEKVEQEETNEEEETKQEELEQEKEELKNTQVEEVEPIEQIEQEELDEIQPEESNRTELQVQETKEIIEKRTLNEKHFLQEDGTIVASVYPMNVHYNLNGKLEDINNSLEEKWRRI